MPAGHSCVIEFEHISAAFALSPLLALSPRDLSLFPSFYAAIYTAISGRRGKTQAGKTGRSFKRDSYFDIGQSLCDDHPTVIESAASILEYNSLITLACINDRC